MIGKRIITAVLTVALVLSGLPGCGSTSQPASDNQASNENASDAGEASSSTDAEPEFSSLSDPDLQRYIEDTTYEQVVEQIDSDQYFVENVQAVYVSQEYLDELAYNSKKNIYFGYNLDELEDQFQGTRYIFTLDEDGHTAVKAVDDHDDTFNQVVRNVAIGDGVILVCVTISAVSAAANAPTVSAIFAASATHAVRYGLEGAAIGAGAAVISTGMQTGDTDEILKAAALSGSEGFKMGAICGAIEGGVDEAGVLRGLTLNGLTMDEAAVIQKEAKYPLDVIRQFHSMDEYQIYQQAGLRAQMVDGKLALVRDIDLNYKSLLADGTEVTNLERMMQGYAPIDPATGKAYQLHHIGQKSDGTLAILTEAEHQGNAGILNIPGKESEIDRNAFAKVRQEFWKSFAESLS